MLYLEKELKIQILRKQITSSLKDSLTILKGDKLLIRTSTNLNSDHRFIELLNPWNQIIFCRWIKLDHISEFTIDFPDKLISGNYVLKYSSENNSKYWIFKHQGRFKENKWYIAYGLTIDALDELEVRLAIPRSFHPYTVVEHLEVIGDKRLIVDTDSYWLSYDLSEYSKRTKRVVLGYKAWIKQNYLLYHPESLVLDLDHKNYTKFNQYLSSELGIESNDTFVAKLTEDFVGGSIISLIYQISHRIHQHLKYFIQKGEFGAKYAVLNRQGDCTEYAALFVALCRHQKIPARLVAGFKKTSTNNKTQWIRHAWAEFFHNQQWIPIDILEGFVIGNFPDVVPLFRGNWIGEPYKQELKILLKDPSSDLDLSKVFLEVKFNIFEQKNEKIPIIPINDLKSQSFANSLYFNIQKDSTYYKLNLEMKINAYPSIYSLLLFIQEQEETSISILHPKIIIHSSIISLDHSNTIYDLKLDIPQIVTHKYLFGAYLCTDRGEIIAYNQINPFPLKI